MSVVRTDHKDPISRDPRHSNKKAPLFREALLFVVRRRYILGICLLFPADTFVRFAIVFNWHELSGVCVALLPKAVRPFELRAIADRAVAVVVAFWWICRHLGSPYFECHWLDLASLHERPLVVPAAFASWLTRAVGDASTDEPFPAGHSGCARMH